MYLKGKSKKHTNMYSLFIDGVNYYTSSLFYDDNNNKNT